jgi:hypothetical protein
LVVAIAMVLASTSVAVGDTNAYVNAQVTMSYVSVRVAQNGSIDYGAMTLGDSKWSSGVTSGYTRFENDGTLASNWQMYTTAPTNSGPPTWGSNSIVLSNGTSMDQALWRAYEWIGFLDYKGDLRTDAGGGVSLASNVAPSGTNDFDFMFLSPSGVSQGGMYTWQGTVVATQF